MAEKLTARKFKAVFDDRVMDSVRDLVKGCENVQRKLGSRYVWESLTSPIGQLRSELERLQGSIRYWCGRARECGLEDPESVIESHKEFQKLMERVECWARWGEEISV